MSEKPKAGRHRPREIGLVENLADVLTAISRLTDYSGRFNCFRGHASANWGAFPSIFRKPPSVVNSEYLMVRDLVSRFPDHFLHDRTMFDRLVRMQHFGLPTRLLDVTSNPLVALFFAICENDLLSEDGALIIFQVDSDYKKYYDSDSISCICNLSNLKAGEKETIENTRASTISDFHRLQPVDRLLQFVREEKPYFQPRIRKDDLFKPYYVVPKRNNQRIVVQSGAFLAFGLKWDDEASFSREISAYLLRIPAAAKLKIKEQISLLGINYSTIFPEIDRSSAQIVEEYS